MITWEVLIPSLR